METEIKFCPRCGAEIAPLTNGYFCPKCGWGEGGSNDIVEIHFGARDSELKGWEYTIPEGMEAKIENGKIIVREKESEDERIRKAIESIIRVYGKTQGEWIAGYDMDTLVVHLRDAFAYLEKQKEQKPAEWSEEDKKMLDRILERGISLIAYGETGLTQKQRVWLASLPKRFAPSNWKPSEEQMEWLTFRR